MIDEDDHINWQSHNIVTWALNLSYNIIGLNLNFNYKKYCMGVGIYWRQRNIAHVYVCLHMCLCGGLCSRVCMCVVVCIRFCVFTCRLELVYKAASAGREQGEIKDYIDGSLISFSTWSTHYRVLAGLPSLWHSCHSHIWQWAPSIHQHGHTWRQPGHPSSHPAVDGIQNNVLLWVNCIGVFECMHKRAHVDWRTMCVQACIHLLRHTRHEDILRSQQQEQQYKQVQTWIDSGQLTQENPQFHQKVWYMRTYVTRIMTSNTPLQMHVQFH